MLNKTLTIPDQDGKDHADSVPGAGEATDEILVERIQRGDSTAGEELVRRYQHKAYAISYRMCSGDGEEAKDMTQEAFLKAFKGIRRFRGQASFYTWFYRIVVNTCLNRIRRQKRWERVLPLKRIFDREGRGPQESLEMVPDGDQHSNPLAALRGKQLSRQVKGTLEALPERQRAAFQLKVLQGMSIKEIAQVMGTAEGTVKSHLFRATHFLQEALKEWIEP